MGVKVNAQYEDCGVWVDQRLETKIDISKYSSTSREVRQKMTGKWRYGNVGRSKK